MKAFGNNITKFGDLPKTSTTMNHKRFFGNAGKANLDASNNLMNPKVVLTFIHKDNTLQVFQSLVNTEDGIVGILGNEIMSSRRILLGNASILIGCFVSISDQLDAIQDNIFFLGEPCIDGLLSLDAASTYVTNV